VGLSFSATAASDPGALCCDAEGLAFELVRELGKCGRIASRGMAERLFQQPIGEPRVSRQERPVEIGADRPVEPTALEARPAVVPETVDDAAKGLGARV
jgi:hypothetical protein